jgi:hypothetical protein
MGGSRSAFDRPETRNRLERFATTYPKSRNPVDATAVIALMSFEPVRPKYEGTPAAFVLASSGSCVVVAASSMVGSASAASSGFFVSAGGSCCVGSGCCIGVAMLEWGGYRAPLRGRVR